MRILFAGTPQPAVPTLQALAADGHDICAVLTRPPAKRGRGRAVHASDVAVCAGGLELPVVTPVSLREPEFETWLRKQDVDVAVVVAYGAMIPTALLEIPRFGWLNLHFSLLPAWRGAAPVQAAIAAGDSITGATVFRIDSGLDTGPVLSVLTESVLADDTAGSLLQRLSTAGAHLVCATLDGLQRGDVRAVAQSGEGISRAPLITTKDAQVDWRLPAAVIERRVRAFTPEPGAWTTLAGSRLRIDEIRTVGPAVEGTSLHPGRLALASDEVLVGTGSQPLALHAVTPAGKKTMSARSWWNGLRRDDQPMFDQAVLDQAVLDQITSNRPMADS